MAVFGVKKSNGSLEEFWVKKTKKRNTVMTDMPVCFHKPDEWNKHG
jgi:hypothetical protein